MDMERLRKQISFLVEIDKIKFIFRRNRLMDNSRYENDAEHSWHLALFAMVLLEHANDPSLEIARVVKMVLIHDVVEIDAGDSFLYDRRTSDEVKHKEAKAADRIFGLLPRDQAAEFRALWREFEDRRTPEARYAAAVDRLHPILHNYHTDGFAWAQHDIRKDTVVEYNRHIEDGSKVLWEYVKTIIDDAVDKGYLQE